jgi:5-methylcytosine-specific restriction endonuclease McrA
MIRGFAMGFSLVRVKWIYDRYRVGLCHGKKSHETFGSCAECKSLRGLDRAA